MTDSIIKWNYSTTSDKMGRTYVVAYHNKWDPVKKQSRIDKRLYVGRLNADTGEVYLSKKFLDANPQYIAQNVFYECNTLVIRSDDEVEAIKKEALNDFSWRCDCVSFGLSYACNEVAKKAQIDKALIEVFGKELGQELLRLAIYQLSSHGMAMQNYEDWLSINYLPKAQPLTSQKVSAILSKVNQENMEQYFTLRHNRLVNINQRKNSSSVNIPLLLAIDSTSISTYSETIDNASFGHAKQDDFLKQINLTLCVDYESGDVCYAYESEGSINDMALFPSILLRMQDIGLKLDNVVLITDRGYSSVMNIQKQLNCDLKFLTGVKLSEDSTKAAIDRYRKALNSPVFLNGALEVYARTADTEKWSSTSEGITIDKDVYLHLYHDGILGENQTVSFMKDVQRLLELKNNNRNDTNLWNKYSRFIEQDPKNKKKWRLITKKIEKQCKYNGYFAIRTNTFQDPFDSLIIYRERNIVEKAFKQFKVLNDGERLYATENTYRGKLFIHIIAQTLRMLMTVAASGHKATGKILPGDSFNKAMLQLQKLQASRPAGRGTYIVKEIPRKTKDLFDLFNIPYPKRLIKD